jgi:lactoylglutathione lyase
MTESVQAAGLFETHLTVSDLDRSVTFYRDIVGLSLGLEVQERGAAFFGSAGRARRSRAVVTRVGTDGLSLHLAFKASLEDVFGASGRLRGLGVTPLWFFATETDEPSVIGWMPAAAVYFRDPDGHLLDYLAMLDGNPRPECGVVSWSRWTS